MLYISTYTYQENVHSDEMIMLNHASKNIPNINQNKGIQDMHPKYDTFLRKSELIDMIQSRQYY